MLPNFQGKITKIGSGLHIVIPQHICKMIDLKPGDPVLKIWDYVNGRLIINFLEKIPVGFTKKTNGILPDDGSIPCDKDFKRETKKWRESQ